MITGALRSTATDAVETLAGLLPFHLLIDKVRYSAAIRLATLPPLHPYTNRSPTQPLDWSNDTPPHSTILCTDMISNLRQWKKSRQENSMLCGNHVTPLKSSQAGNLPLTRLPLTTPTSKSTLTDQESMTRSGPAPFYTETTEKKLLYATYLVPSTITQSTKARPAARSSPQNLS